MGIRVPPECVEHQATFVKKDDFGIRVVIRNKAYNIPRSEEYLREWEHFSEEDHGKSITVRISRAAAQALNLSFSPFGGSGADDRMP